MAAIDPADGNLMRIRFTINQVWAILSTLASIVIFIVSSVIAVGVWLDARREARWEKTWSQLEALSLATNENTRGLAITTEILTRHDTELARLWQSTDVAHAERLRVLEKLAELSALTRERTAP